jgi:hypothetical protein
MTNKFHYFICLVVILLGAYWIIVTGINLIVFLYEVL